MNSRELIAFVVPGADVWSGSAHVQRLVQDQGSVALVEAEFEVRHCRYLRSHA